MTYRAVADLMDEDKRVRLSEMGPAKDQKEYAMRMLSAERSTEPRKRFDV